MVHDNSITTTMISRLTLNLHDASSMPYFTPLTTRSIAFAPMQCPASSAWSAFEPPAMHNLAVEGAETGETSNEIQEVERGPFERPLQADVAMH